MNKLAIAAVSLMLSSPVFSEPTPNVLKFMQTPVSLLSFGLYKLNQEIKEDFAKRGGQGYVYAWYQLEKNKIVLQYSDKQNHCTDMSREGCERACEIIFNQMRASLCNGKECEKANLFPSYFSHGEYIQRNFIGKKNDHEAAEDLKNITDVIVFLGMGAGVKKRFVCEGPVTREKPSFRTAG